MKYKTKEFTLIIIIQFIVLLIFGYILILNSQATKELEARVLGNEEEFDKFAEVHNDNVDIYNNFWEDQWEWNEDMTGYVDEVYENLR